MVYGDFKAADKVLRDKTFNIAKVPKYDGYRRGFGAVSLTKHADIDQYKYSGYGIGFDRKGDFSFGNGFS